MLTKEQLNRFEADGYLVLNSVLDDQALDPVRRLVTRVVHERTCQLYEAGKIADLFEDTPFDVRWARVARDYLQHAKKPFSQGWVWGQHELLDRAIYDLYTDVRLTAIVTSILGPEVTANGDYWVRPKIPMDLSTTLAWHRDSFYYGGLASAQLPILSVWIPLVDVNEENGCLRLIPGSHRSGDIPHRTNEYDQQEPTEDVACYGTPRNEPMEVGDVLLFTNLTLHGSGENGVEDHVRWSIDLRYMPTGQSFEWHALGDKFNVHFPCFVACSVDPVQVTSWEEWRNRWAASPKA